ncbi:MAG: hypothetical protein FWF08_09375 [Oscillospiraceae bacterium]|nr:hypothetical protein [Oscillospiraceae bacterium]
MNKHQSSFEQYCCVMKKNVVMEETVFHNGEKAVKCVYSVICDNNGGCKNKILKKVLSTAT